MAPLPNSIRARDIQPIQSILSRRILAIAIVQALFSLAIAKWQLYPEIESLQGALSATLANNIAHSANNAFEHPITAMRATVDVLNSHADPKLNFGQSAVRQLVESQRAAESAYILGADGKIQTVSFSLQRAAGRNPLSRLGLDMSRNALFVKRNLHDVAISPVFISSVSEQLQVALTAPLRGGALLVLELGLVSLAAEINATVSGSDLQVMIADSSGQLVANPDTSRSGESVLLPIAVVNAMARSAATTFQWNGQSWFATSAPVGKLDWYAVVMRPERSVYAPITAIVGLMLATTATLLLFSYIALLVTTRGMQRATEDLIADAHQLELGHIPPEHHFKILEWSQLDTSLRIMAHALLQREKLLKQSNEALEVRVRERTDHLEHVNEALQNTLLRLQATQDELVQSGKMAALGSMVAGVAHELNTPIGNARLVATTLVDRAQSLSDMLASGRVSRREIDQIALDFQNAAEIIDKSLSRASDLVRSFKQVASDQTSNQRRKFKLADVVRENELLLSPRLSKSGVTLGISISPDLEMDSYPGDLGQVITNLVENAVVHAYADFQGGCVDIAAHLLSGNETVVLTISDHGHGMDNATQARIFDPFFTTRMGRGGTGLGLSIVFGIVTKSLGGRIRVESEVAKGARFVLELARIAPQPSASIDDSSTH
jgi:signal transduction histidine kinase